MRLRLFLLVAALLATFLGLWWVATGSSDLHFLPARGPAQWLVYPSPPNADGLAPIRLGAEFRRTFVIARPPTAPRLAVCAFTEYSVQLNGKAVGPPVRAGKNWKKITQFDLSGLLSPGTNELSVIVLNAGGPPALWLSLAAGEFRLVSDASWRVSFAGGAWRPAAIASAPVPIRQGNLIYGAEEPLASLRARLSLFLVLLALSGGILAAGRWWMARWGRRALPWGAKNGGGGYSMQVIAGIGLLAVAWAVLWGHNAGKVPRLTGFDAHEHLAYVQYILDKHALPLANEGWEMYQPPLYYLLAALELGVLHLSTADLNGTVALRFFGMACGIVTFVLVFLSVRLVYPNQSRSQLFGLLLAGLLPANLYLCHYVTNEILTATLVAAALYLCLRILRNPQISLWQHAGLGLGLGAALLTKTSAVLALPVALVAVGWNLARKGVRSPAQPQPRSAAFTPLHGASTAAPNEHSAALVVRPVRRRKRRAPMRPGSFAACEQSATSRCSAAKWAGVLGLVLLVCLAVSGWHYYRVASHFGSPLIGNWDPRAGFHWWQQPGYRTGAYYAHFGQCLVQPIYSAFAGFWDGVYSTLWGDGLCGGESDLAMRPPWNYDLMTAGYLYALPLTVIILTGVVLSIARFTRDPRAEEFTLLGLAFLAGLSLVYYSLKVPVYASSKAFYASAALVPLCAFGASGLEFWSRQAGRWRWAIYLVVTLWALNTYASFWIRPDAADTRILWARAFALDGRHDRAVQQLQKVLQEHPRQATARQLLARELARQGRLEEAESQAQEAVRCAPGDGECHLVLGTILYQQGQVLPAIAEARQALELAPDHPVAASSLFAWLYASRRKEEALAAGEESLRVNPFSPDFHYGVALASEDLGDHTNAVVHFGLAAALKPEWPEAHDKLGLSLGRLNQWERAVAQFSRAAQLRPEDPALHYHLGLGLVRLGKTATAIEEFRRALQLNAGFAPGLNALAWVMATGSDGRLRDGAEAVRLATRACELTDWKSVAPLKTLAAAYAECGRFDEAIGTLRQAMDLARAAGTKEAAGAEEMLELFKLKQAYHQSGR